MRSDPWHRFMIFIDFFATDYELDEITQTFVVTDMDWSSGPSIGVPESPELVDETLSRRLN